MLSVFEQRFPGQEQGKDGGKQSREVVQDLADVVAAAAENGKNGVAERAFERAKGEATVGLHVSDLGLDGAAALEQFREYGVSPRRVPLIITRKSPLAFERKAA